MEAKTDGRRICLFGDSHIGLYRSLPRASFHHLGGYTMHRVGRDGVASLRLSDGMIADGEPIGLTFGEIDIRAHVAPQSELPGRSSVTVLDDLLSAYLKTVQALQQRFPRSRICIFMVVPPAGMDFPNFDPQFPRKGTDQQRAEWTRSLNAEIARRTPELGFHAIDQYSMFKDASGLLDKSCSPDGVHIRPDLMNRVDLTVLTEE